MATSASRDPNAPTPPDTMFHDARHTNVLSCEACHIPYKVTPADIFVDNSLSGITKSYKTSAFLSADPQDPSNPDKSRWHPAMGWKKDSDGVQRVFPAKLLLSAWWGDWNQNGTPNDLTDDTIKPIPLWRVRYITQGGNAGFVAADGTVNTPQEIRAYIDALRGNDQHDNQVAGNPVLVKGGNVWHDDGKGSATHFEYHGTGINTESSHPFSVSHNVRSGKEAWGAAGCSDCHSVNSPVFDRKILVDPFGPDGKPIYKTARGMLQLSPR